MSAADQSLPIEQFIQALTTQLDHAQSAMAIKARNMSLPLTFAVRDITLDLRTHVDFVASEVRIRPAAAGDKDASTLHLALTTITRPMIEENSAPPTIDHGGQSLKEFTGDSLSDEDRKRLEWAGVQTVDQLRRMQETGGDRVVERVTSLPIDRLRQALARANAPSVEHVLPYSMAAGASPTLLRVAGRNLMNGHPPRVTIGGEPVGLVKASATELLLAPHAHQMAGELVVEPMAGSSTATAFNLTGFWREPTPPPEPEPPEPTP
ncbi:MAG: hypothetical protein QOF70_7403 [Acetobacteraceae bacterium]|nr:hypothetical protein [Acetobacteraceae bacterium]